jgi:hypothetical protein
LLNDGAVDRSSFASAVEIDEMQISGALFHPPAGEITGIAAEHRFLVKFALPQADALTAAKVDGRQNEHRRILAQ